MTGLPAKRISTCSLATVTAVVVIAFVVATLSVAREILIPVALAALLTFMLSPLVTRLERWIGRGFSVVLVVLLLCVASVAAAWTIAGQFLDLAKELPKYEDNIIAKVRAFPMPKSRTFAAFSKMLEDLKKELPAASPPAEPKPEAKDVPSSPVPLATRPVNDAAPLPVKVVESPNVSQFDQSKQFLEKIFDPLAKVALVVLLLICMLAKREDLRNRFIRVIGQGHISSTTRAMADAERRVSRYLVMQFAMNTAYGALLAVGLYFIGVPNAVLWGVFAALLRYVPYVGIWIAALFPVALSLAVAKGWTMPILTLSLFLLLEIACANLLEPMVYGSSTGVSSVALILAAVFWTWIWGPAGLVLSTPLTVCLVVIGTHVPKLEFLSVLLSDERALTPSEDLYFRLLSPSDQDEMEVVDTCLKEHSLTEVYDTVLVPVVATAGIEAQRETLDSDHLSRVEEGLRHIVQELRDRPQESFALADGKKKQGEEKNDLPTFPACRVLCLPAHSEHDALVGDMLEHLLELRGCETHGVSGSMVSGELISVVEKHTPDLVCISVVAFSAVSNARYLCLKLRKQFPDLKIIVGLWHASEDVSASTQRLRDAGANEVVTTLADAVITVRKIAPRIQTAMIPAAVPFEEADRLKSLHELNVLDAESDSALEKITERVARLLKMPMSFVGLVDRDRLFFLSQRGLPEDLAEARQAPREVTVCGHVIVDPEPTVVEDLARDVRFANNPWLTQHGMRFYAGVPLFSREGHVIGTLCVMDRKPRSFGEREMKELQDQATEVMKEIERMGQLAEAA